MARKQNKSIKNNHFKKALFRKKGASLTGYGLTVGLISVIALVSVTNVGTQITRLFDNVGNRMSDVASSETGAGSEEAAPAPNIIPTVILAADPSAEIGSGLQTIASFATFNAGAGESGQAVLDYFITETSAPNDVVSGVDIQNDGTLVFTPNIIGSEIIEVQVQDDGGTANGGVDTSLTITFTITVTAPPNGTGFCANNPPIATEEGCDPNNGTIFVGIMDADGPATSGAGLENSLIYTTPYDLSTTGAVMVDAVTDQGQFKWKLPNVESSIPYCTSLGDTGSHCYDGQFLTAQVLTDSGSHPAMEACDSLSFGGHSDWYLPSPHELRLVYDNLRTIDSDGNADDITDIFGFDISSARSNEYKASSEYNNGNSGTLQFRVGNSAADGKDNDGSVRCVRR